MKILIILIIFLITASFNQAFSEDGSDGYELVDVLLAIAGLSGVAGLFWAIYEYKESRNDKRKETFFELTGNFDTSKEMLFAKKILDTWTLAYSEKKGRIIDSSGMFGIHLIEWILARGYGDRLKFEKEHPDIFSKMSKEDLDDAWRELRDSFDALFDFFERLTYLYKNKRITVEEIVYFDYFIKPARDNEKITDFLDYWGYTWHKELIYP